MKLADEGPAQISLTLPPRKRRTTWSATMTVALLMCGVIDGRNNQRSNDRRMIMTRGIARLLAKMFGALVLLSAIIFIIVAFNERETASVLANSLWVTLQGGHDIEATSPHPHVDYLAETALHISFFTFLVSTFGTAFTVLLGWSSDRGFKLKILQLEAQVTELKRQSLKDKAGTSQPLD
jgi:hypothetical protein